MKKFLMEAGFIIAAAGIATYAIAGIVIPNTSEHRDLHSAVIFTGAEKAGDWVTLDIQAVQTGDFIQYVGPIIIDCEKSKDQKDPPKANTCARVGQEVNSWFTQYPQKTGDHAQIQQLVDLDLTGWVFLATILKKQ